MPPARSHRRAILAQALAAAAMASACGGCTGPSTSVVFANDYLPTAPASPVVYTALWQAITLAAPLVPGASSEPALTVAASANTAYAVLAPGWSPSSKAAPTSLVALQSRSGYAVDLDGALTVPIDDAAFAGDCGSGSPLTQAEADVITGLVFPQTFAGFTYDAATCRLTADP
jgi:hypothetical protein